MCRCRGARRSSRPICRRRPALAPHFDVSRDAPLAEFEKVAARYPVFRVVAE